MVEAIRPDTVDVPPEARAFFDAMMRNLEGAWPEHFAITASRQPETQSPGGVMVPASTRVDIDHTPTMRTPFTFAAGETGCIPNRFATAISDLMVLEIRQIVQIVLSMPITNAKAETILTRLGQIMRHQVASALCIREGEEPQ